MHFKMMSVYIRGILVVSCPAISDIGSVGSGIFMFFWFFSPLQKSLAAGFPISGLHCCSSLRKRKPRKPVA